MCPIASPPAYVLRDFPTSPDFVLPSFPTSPSVASAYEGFGAQFAGQGNPAPTFARACTLANKSNCRRANVKPRPFRRLLRVALATLRLLSGQANRPYRIASVGPARSDYLGGQGDPPSPGMVTEGRQLFLLVYCVQFFGWQKRELKPADGLRS